MNNAQNIAQTIARSLAAVLAASLVAGCGGANRMLPAAPLPGAGALDSAAAPSLAREPAGERITVQMQMLIPRRNGRAHDRHPATISPLTQSVGIAMNGGGQHVFNATPASPNCSIGTGGTLCTFAFAAKVGTDSFVVTTYSGASGSGTILDRGTATFPVQKGKANAIVVRLGAVVTTTANSGVGSLRYAIASANAGDTIMFMLPAGSTITVASPILIKGNVTLAGPGAASTITISGGNAHQIFSVTGKATISGLTLTQGKAAVPSTPGGAIANTGSLTLINDKIGASTSIVSLKHAPHPHLVADAHRKPHCTNTASEGGALYNAGTLTMSGNTFNANVIQSDVVNCIQAEGGAIFNDITGTLASNGDTFTNNSALAGGAVFNAGYGQVSFTNDNFTGNTGCTTASGCPTSGCNNSGCTSYAEGEGAAIFDAGFGVTIVSSHFTNNIAGGESTGSHGIGGALVLTSGIPSVTGSVFTGNLAGGGTASCSTGQGGAIAAEVAVELDNDTFTSNGAIGDSTSAGGAVFGNTTVTGSNDVFKSNKVVGSGSACSASSTGAGGGVFALTQATLTNSSFVGNFAYGNSTGAGAALACTACVVSGGTFTSNSAVGTGGAGAASSSSGGAALYSTGIAKISGSTFTSNTAKVEGPHAQEASGGAIVVTAGGLVSSHNIFTSNAVSDPIGAGAAVGGAVAVVSGTFVSNGDTYKSNSATGTNIVGGGGAYVATAYIVSNALFSGNSVSGGAQTIGGGLAAGAAGQISSATFTANTATTSAGLAAGGALYDALGSTVTNSTVSQNSASTTGGGIFAGTGETLVGSSITGNKVTAAQGGGGGGIASAGNIIIDSSTIANNAVTLSGSAQSGGGGIFNGGGLQLTQSTVSGNAVLGSAPSSGGGGIYNNAAAALTNVTIAGNSSSLDGGGIELAANDMVALLNVTLFQNKATGNGGNIDNLYTMSLANTIVAGGTAASGADVKNAGTLTSGDYNIIQTPVVGTAISGATTHNLAVNPLLLALSNNGGTTFTNADQLTSPGRAHIPFAANTCGNATVPIDQRGYARGAGGHCDVGAFEYSGVPTAARHHLATRVRSRTAQATMRFPTIHPAPLGIQI